MCQSCTSAQSTSIISGSKAVDFAAFAAGILTLVLNVNNNINNNNNNNNNLNINAVDSSNIVANFNTNNANQVNIHTVNCYQVNKKGLKYLVLVRPSITIMNFGFRYIISSYLRVQWGQLQCNC